VENPLNSLVRTLRLRGVWLLILPFFYLANPTAGTLAWGMGIAGLGLIVRGWAAGHIRKDEELATGGPYAHTRNPLYLGSFLIGVGVTVAGAQPIFLALFAVLFLGVYAVQSRVEAAYLQERYGESYSIYAAHVPLLLPRPLPDSTPIERTHFRGARYFLNREWEAGLGVLAGFAGLLAKLIWF
jgi:protein-S-isoprenylcysteine O-methyltransferase Ste14